MFSLFYDWQIQPLISSATKNLSISTNSYLGENILRHSTSMAPSHSVLQLLLL